MEKVSKIEKWIIDNTNKHICECGCGEFIVPTYFRYFRDKPFRFINLHQNRGINHPNFKTGIVQAKGYIWILTKNHPRRTPRGYVKRCWLVAEKKIGRYLIDGEVVHHKDGNKLNDDQDNLMVTTQSVHVGLHGIGKYNKSYRHDIEVERDIEPLLKERFSAIEIAKILGCAKKTIYRRLEEYRKSSLQM